MSKTENTLDNNKPNEAPIQANSAATEPKEFPVTAVVYSQVAKLTSFEKKIFLKVADMECRGKRRLISEWEKFHSEYKNRTTK